MEGRTGGYVLLGRDGVIIRRVANGSAHLWEQVEFLPRALDGLRLFAENGFKVLVFSGEESVGTTLHSGHELQRLTQRLLLEISLAGGKIERVYQCADSATDACRGGLLFTALPQALTEYDLRAEETYVISDSVEDTVAAALGGCAAILLQRDAFLTSGVPGDGGCEEIASSLYEAAERMVCRISPSFEEIVRREWPEFDFSQSEEVLAHSAGSAKLKGAREARVGPNSPRDLLMHL